MLKNRNPRLAKQLREIERIALIKQGILVDYVAGIGVETNYNTEQEILHAFKTGDLYLNAEGQRLLTSYVNELIGRSIFFAYTNKEDGYSDMTVEGELYRIHAYAIRNDVMYHQTTDYWEHYLERGFRYTTNVLIEDKVREYKANSQEVILRIGEKVKTKVQGILSEKDYQEFVQESKAKVEKQIYERIPNYEPTRSTQARINHYFKRRAVYNYVQETIIEQKPTTAKEVMQAKEKVQQQLVDNLIAEIGRDNDYQVSPSKAIVESDSFDDVYRGINYSHLLQELYKGCVVITYKNGQNQYEQLLGTLNPTYVKKATQEVQRDLKNLQSLEHKEELERRVKQYNRLLVYSLQGKPTNLPRERITQVVLEGKTYVAKDDPKPTDTGRALRELLVYEKEDDYKRHERFVQALETSKEQKFVIETPMVSKIYGKGYVVRLEYATKGKKLYYYISPKGVFRNSQSTKKITDNQTEIEVLYKIDPNEGKEQQIQAIYKALKQDSGLTENSVLKQMLTMYNYSFDLRMKRYKEKK